MIPVKHARKIISSLFVPISFFFFPLWLFSASTAVFFYFNPDSPQSNMSRLKEAMDSVLAVVDIPLAFQPFAKFSDFDRKVREEPPDFLLLPEWYLKQDGNDKKYEPFLVPVRNGNTTYRKVLLVSRDSSVSIQDLPRVTIAMTPMGMAGMEDLNKVIFNKYGLDGNKLNFVTTAKDSDALFALALNQVRAALVSTDNLDHFGAINPRVLQVVKQLAISDPIPLPLLCFNKDIAGKDEVEKMKSIFLKGKNDSRIAEMMEMLHIDAWQTIN
ncbi:MAG: PhnD/SsuA/transferrin family substrate-binding protein [Pseudomonadota bacterium]